MHESATMPGVLAPVVTPFGADLEPDSGRLIAHCRWLARQGCGLAAFGTNSEANSLSVAERMTLLDELVAAGLDPGSMLPGTGTCALPDTVALTRHAVGHGVRGVLMLPPFYYKGVDDEGLYRGFSEVIERVGDDRLRIYLYHIPQLSGVPIGIDLIGRLCDAFPGIVAGMKDSSGEPANLARVLGAFPGFRLYAGTELLLTDNLRLGGVGCISATANINPGAIVEQYRHWQDDAGPGQQALDAVRRSVQRYPMIAALKHVIAHYRDDTEWRRLRPPLTSLAALDGAALIAELEAVQFRFRP
ncbi:MAG: dihydrodipicolinate synthase family protein [Woeseiaceae bacterium]|nr:dihydrodipicolinate synthase family protein [Woeseiaceae bacterium]